MRDRTSEAIKSINALLESEQHPPNTRLPTERELAAKLVLPRATIRKALSVLEAENKIWRHVGRGTFVGSKSTEENNIAVITDVSLSTSPAEIMELRLVLEPKTAALAAVRSTQNDTEKIEQNLIKSEVSESFEAFEQWDELFHFAIAESSHNALILSLFKMINNLRHDRIWGHLKRAANTNKRQQNYSRHHREIFGAIKNRDPVQAEKIMKLHLDVINRNLINNF
jgi:DNA-binding FadR family transcriptional regulator